MLMLSLPRTFTPVPKRVMDGSEDTEVLAAAVLSGAPMELQARAVRYVSSHTHPPTSSNNDDDSLGPLEKELPNIDL